MTWSFSLILKPAPMDLEAVANRLYEAGCDDATFGICCGVWTLDFDREAGSLDEAVASAKADVERAGLGVERVDLEGKP